MKKRRSQSTEDYLKAIYEITLYEERASTTQLAEYLDITPASITGMIQKLSTQSPPLVEYQKHRGVTLTPQGQKVALETLRHHRLLELFLHDILGYPWDEVDEEAERLEHVISEKFEERIAAVLGNPDLDPHGDPIPASDLSVPKVSRIRMSSLQPGQAAVITRVNDTDANLLRYLGKLGLYLNTRFTVTDYSEFDQNLSIKINDQDKTIVLGPGITENIFVAAKQ
ncbi:MAG: metal-dependent transcriptional regulator [Anaerolineales bacterium]|nr:metal-dependent transcriptional regulator [Anaerolineales bacterium]